MDYYYISDFHLHHANILKYCGRTLFMDKSDLAEYNRVKNLSREEQQKFKISDESLALHDTGIINRHNERVKSGDVVIYIGDFCFYENPEEYEKQLNGKFIFIKGNHDKHNSCKIIIHRMVISAEGHQINIVHNPEFVDTNYSINLVGHVHGKWKIRRIRKGYQFTDAINMSVDVWDFYPRTLQEILQRHAQWKRSQ